MAYFESKFSATHSSYLFVRLVCVAQIYIQTTLIYKTLGFGRILYSTFASHSPYSRYGSFAMLGEKSKLYSRTKPCCRMGLEL